MNERQENIINKLNSIADIAQELMNEAVIGEDGNLKEMVYHIKCYTKKIAVHLFHEWKNNEKFKARRDEKAKSRIEQLNKENEEVRQLNKKIFGKFYKNNE